MVVSYPRKHNNCFQFTQHWTTVLKALFPLFPSSSCYVKLFSLTDYVPWKYVTSSFLRTVPFVMTFLLNTLTLLWTQTLLLIPFVHVPLKNCSPLDSSYVNLYNHPVCLCLYFVYHCVYILVWGSTMNFELYTHHCTAGLSS